MVLRGEGSRFCQTKCKHIMSSLWALGHVFDPPQVHATNVTPHPKYLVFEWSSILFNNSKFAGKKPLQISVLTRDFALPPQPCIWRPWAGRGSGNCHGSTGIGRNTSNYRYPSPGTHLLLLHRLSTSSWSVSPKGFPIPGKRYWRRRSSPVFTLRPTIRSCPTAGSCV